MQGLLLAHIIYTMSEGNRSTSAGLRRQSLAQGFVGLIWCTVPNIPLPATFCLPLRPGSQAHMHACIHQDGKISRMSAFDNEAILVSLSCLCFCNMLHAPSMIHFSPFPAGRSFPPAGGSSCATWSSVFGGAASTLPAGLSVAPADSWTDEASCSARRETGVAKYEVDDGRLKVNILLCFDDAF